MRNRNAFTLVEMLIVITIIGIIAAMSMAALLSAAEEGRLARARAQVAKIDQIISEKWNSYRFRQLPIRIPAGTNPVVAAQTRLSVMRELQRMELPDRIWDVLDNPVTAQPLPAVTRAYRRKIPPAVVASVTGGTYNTYDQAEMLYLIISEIRDGDKSALENFMNSEIGDVDGDGLYEILDPWGEPIFFLRWAPGYSRATISDAELAGKISAPAPLPEVAVSTFQIPDGSSKPDAFDPLKVDPRWSNNAAGFKPFLIRPLIFSAGPDKVYDIYTENQGSNIRYSQTAAISGVPNDPYVPIVSGGQNVWVGSPADYDGDGDQNGDNITNHGLELIGE